jgi:hypothetical protein
MSEERAPYGPQQKKSPPEKIAWFINDFLGQETLLDIPYPECLQGDPGDFNQEEREYFLSFTYFSIFQDSVDAVSGILARDLFQWELGLISRKLIIFLKKNGYELNGD